MILHWEEWWRSMVCEGPLAWHFQTIHHPHRIIHHPIPVASFGLSDHVGEYPQIWSNFMVHHGSSPFSHIFPTKNRDIRIPFMAPFGIIHRFTGKKTSEPVRFWRWCIVPSFLRYSDPRVLTCWTTLGMGCRSDLQRCCWEMEEFMEIFYAGWWWLEPWNFMTFHSVGNVIIPTDEVHHFSEG